MGYLVLARCENPAAAQESQTTRLYAERATVEPYEAVPIGMGDACLLES